ncbi:hypothetical protein P7F73_18485 [Enterobacter sp. EC-ML 621]|uniref:hypothetical protein n=1 Tax=Enterobacter sp. EC-ML 621 TaxID=3037555 RepID=UPI002853CDEC|nr:hypothetical protein [Enterobacter sp. EC-ML 621]MDR5095803.1 hypothetical protein [Enterobacter sp. EC-ML 621]
MKNRLLQLSAISIFLLSGCAPQRINQVQKDAEETGSKASALITQMSDNLPVVQFENDQYINPVPISKPKFDAPVKITRCQVQYKTTGRRTFSNSVRI